MTSAWGGVSTRRRRRRLDWVEKVFLVILVYLTGMVVFATYMMFHAIFAGGC